MTGQGEPRPHSCANARGEFQAAVTAAGRASAMGIQLRCIHSVTQYYTRADYRICVPRTQGYDTESKTPLMVERGGRGGGAVGIFGMVVGTPPLLIPAEWASGAMGWSPKRSRHGRPNPCYDRKNCADKNQVSARQPTPSPPPLPRPPTPATHAKATHLMRWPRCTTQHEQW